MKILFSVLFALILSAQAHAAANTCGAAEIGKAAATIDMELDLLRSGLYDIVRNESMIYISNIVRNHLVQAQVCDNQSYDLLVNTLRTIDTLVINNPNKADYSINTSVNIYSTFKNLVGVLERSAQGYLSQLLANSGGGASSCGALEIGKAVATIDMELDLLRSGLYNIVRNESMIYISNIVRNHFMNAQVCDNQSYDLLVNTIRTIDTLVINNPNKADYSINTSQNIYMTFQNLASVLENSADSHLESLIYTVK